MPTVPPCAAHAHAAVMLLSACFRHKVRKLTLQVTCLTVIQCIRCYPVLDGTVLV